MEIHLDIFNHAVPDNLRKLIEEPVNEDLIGKNKFANNSEFISEAVYKRILNRITNYQWSFLPYSVETVDGGGKAYIRYIGLLVVPGFGVHTGIGTQLLSKSDNSNATAAAKTYAFKNACKEMGLAPNVGGEGSDDELFENDIVEEEEPPKKKKKKAAPEAEKKKKPAKKKVATQEERIKEIRDAYELEDEDDFIAFIQIWDADIIELEDLDEDDWDKFLAYLEKNKSEFEEF